MFDFSSAISTSLFTKYDYPDNLCDDRVFAQLSLLIHIQLKFFKFEMIGLNAEYTPNF